MKLVVRKVRKSRLPVGTRKLVEMLVLVREAADARGRCVGWNPEADPVMLSLILDRIIRSAKAGRLLNLLRATPAYVS